MGAIRHRTGTFILILAGCAEALGQRFFPDDPLSRMPTPLSADVAGDRDVNQLYDFLRQSRQPHPRSPVAAGAINTLGEVPDSPWFTNRHGKTRMTPDELRKGPPGEKPRPPYTVVEGKSEGASLGFQMKDASGRLFFVKLDPTNNPEMASAADVIVSRFLYAIGYNTPANFIVNARDSDFTLAPDATITTFRYGPEERMTWGDLQDTINSVPRNPDGTFRMLASLAVEGKPIGPFRFEGTRRDDPNDIVPHENRRDLRGLFVFAAWLNHTDSKAGNTLDTLVEENGITFVRHHLIDFGAALGSDGTLPKDPRFGHDFMLPQPSIVWRRILTLGFHKEPWERASFVKTSGVGNFEASTFDPEKWKSNFPNPAFLSRTPEDEFWAAKIVMSFTDEDIRAIVQTGEFSNPAAAEYIARVLIERRDKIGKAFFSKVLPLDKFRVRDGDLEFTDLRVQYGMQPPQYRVSWFLFDNATEASTPSTPEFLLNLAVGSYVEASVESLSPPGGSVRVTFRKTAVGFEAVGIERKAMASMDLSSRRPWGPTLPSLSGGRGASRP